MVNTKKNDGTFEIRPASIRHLAEAGIEYEISDLYPEKNDGYDIADDIMIGVLPEIKPTLKPVHPEEKAIAKVINDDAMDYDLPKGVSFEDVKWDIRKYMHIFHEGKLFIVRKNRGGSGETDSIARYYCSPITNFEIKALGLIASEIDPTRLVEIKNIHGHSEVVKVPTKAFASNTGSSPCSWKASATFSTTEQPLTSRRFAPSCTTPCSPSMKLKISDGITPAISFSQMELTTASLHRSTNTDSLSLAKKFLYTAAELHHPRKQ